jgi:hypothetical protein
MDLPAKDEKRVKQANSPTSTDDRVTATRKQRMPYMLKQVQHHLVFSKHCVNIL